MMRSNRDHAILRKFEWRPKPYRIIWAAVPVEKISKVFKSIVAPETTSWQTMGLIGQNMVNLQPAISECMFFSSTYCLPYALADILGRLPSHMSVKPVAILRGVITQELAEKAFTKIQSDPRFAVEGCHLVLIKESRYEDILIFLRDSFYADEPIAKSVNLEWDGDLVNMIMDILKQNLSIAFVSSKTGEVIGVQAMVISNRREKIDTTQYKSEKLRNFVSLTEHLDSLQNNVYDHFKVEDIVFFFHLAVQQEYRRRGIATTLFRAAVAFVESFDIGPFVLRVDGSSNFSKRIFEKLGFQVLAELDYDDYKVDGKVMITNAGEHKSMQVYAMVVGGFPPI